MQQFASSFPHVPYFSYVFSHFSHTFQAWLGDGQPGLSSFQAAGSPQQRGATRCGFLEPRRAAGRFQQRNGVNWTATNTR